MKEIDGVPITAVGRGSLIAEIDRLEAENVRIKEILALAESVFKDADAALRAATTGIAERDVEILRLNVAIAGATETIKALESERARFLERVKSIGVRWHGTAGAVT
jgi:hypothetical protein